MLTVAVEGQFRFVVNTRENSFEHPHVHIWVGNEDVSRTELNGQIALTETLYSGMVLSIYNILYAQYLLKVRARRSEIAS